MQVAANNHFHTHVNIYGTFVLLGNLSGLSVLDLPSGPGLYAKKMIKDGAATVTSVDLDSNFVKSTKAIVKPVLDTQHMSGGIKTTWHGITADACIRRSFSGGPFDVGTVLFLWFYITSRLRSLVRRIPVSCSYLVAN
jgi:2-polyprenyl-3-methyl-5-hydroxy-6-metoxy-1,4-benzoquinol methylase